MTEPIRLLVPESVGAFYAVPTRDATVQTTSLVAAALGQVESALPKPLPQPLVQVHPIDDLPPLPVDALMASGATDAQLRRLAEATHLVLVSVGGRPGWPPAHEWIARTLAAGAAQHLDADVVDLHAYQVLDRAAVRASLPDAEGTVSLTDWVGVVCWPEQDRFSCATTGLRRFGLPEIQTHALAAEFVDPWSWAMVAVAGQLLAAWRDALQDFDGSVPAAAMPTIGSPRAVHGTRAVELPSAFTITENEIIDVRARATERGGPKLSASGPESALVRLTLDQAPGQHWPGAHFTVRPPQHADDYFADACTVLFGQSTVEL